MAADDEKVYSLNRMNSRAFKHGLGDLLNERSYTSAAAAGGAVSEQLVVTGIAAADTIIGFYQSVAGANSLAAVAISGHSADAVDVEWTADPGAGAVLVVRVQKADTV